jgi:hypothetical protein
LTAFIFLSSLALTLGSKILAAQATECGVCGKLHERLRVQKETNQGVKVRLAFLHCQTQGREFGKKTEKSWQCF